MPISFDLSVCAEKNYTMLNYEKQSLFYVRSNYPDGQGTSSIFCKEREKISILTAKPSALLRRRAVGYAVALPRAPTSSKEQNGVLRNRA